MDRRGAIRVDLSRLALGGLGDSVPASYVTAATFRLGTADRNDPEVLALARQLYDYDQQLVRAAQPATPTTSPAPATSPSTSGSTSAPTSSSPAPTTSSAPAPYVYREPAPTPAAGPVSAAAIQHLINAPQPTYGEPTGAAAAPPPPSTPSIPPSQEPSAASDSTTGPPTGLLAALGRPVVVAGFSVPSGAVLAGAAALVLWLYRRWKGARRGR